jgi:bifunctional N-acetylglucosamine-1-phosphate-uridyltransferase/glucosamine-1-phosphate-acetyltransferase GlmU-like protein
MKAILLAGGKGTRLRPLTVHTPKPIVPIFNRPFLYYQLDLLRQVPEIDEAILSLNYQPRRIEEIFGEGEGLGHSPALRGRADAARHRAARSAMPATSSPSRWSSSTATCLTQVDLGAVLRLHRERKAKATIVLTPVENPRAYGPGRDRRLQQHPALSREARRGRDHLQHDQRRHLRAGARRRSSAFRRTRPWSIERSFFRR